MPRIVVITCALWSLTVGTVDAAPPMIPDADLSPSRYDARFKGIPLGQSVDAFRAYVTKTFTEQCEARLERVQEPHARDVARAETVARIKSTVETVVEFDGQRTGYNVSIIGGDFAHGTGETMIVVTSEDGKSQDYNFFVKGQLWKVVTTQARRGTFPELLIHLTEVYGAPNEIEYRVPNRKQDPVRARWSAKDLWVEARARPDFNALTVTFAHRPIADRIVELRGTNKPPADTSKQGLDQEILDLMDSK